MNPVHVLLRLYPGYGLGDAVQMTSVLRHLRKHRPHWIIDYQADDGRHSAAIGLVRNVFAYDDAPPASRYDREIDIVLYDTFAAWPDRPNTRVVSCLHERFGMEWDASCASYEINITEKANKLAFDFLCSIDPGWRSCVAIQYQGDSSQVNKNLTEEQAEEICGIVQRMGRIPLLMDWRNLSLLPDGIHIHTTGRMSISNEWGRDAQMNAAIISQCEAFIGIDSGPGKCASATKTPTLICWTGHHPALFHDPHEGTTHLVPANHRDNPILKGNREVADFFEKNYHWRPYTEPGFFDNTLVNEIAKWLKENLK